MLKSTPDPLSPHERQLINETAQSCKQRRRRLLQEQRLARHIPSRDEQATQALNDRIDTLAAENMELKGILDALTYTERADDGAVRVYDKYQEGTDLARVCPEIFKYVK